MLLAYAREMNISLVPASKEQHSKVTSSRHVGNKLAADRRISVWLAQSSTCCSCAVDKGQRNDGSRSLVLALPSLNHQLGPTNRILRYYNVRHSPTASRYARAARVGRQETFQFKCSHETTCLCHSGSDLPGRPSRPGAPRSLDTRASRQASAFDLRHHETGLTLSVEYARQRAQPRTGASPPARAAHSSLGTSRAATQTTNAPANSGSPQHLLRKPAAEDAKGTASTKVGNFISQETPSTKYLPCLCCDALTHVAIHIVSFL